MLFRINPGDAVPLYHQIARQVRDAVASGKLRPGDKLPSQRQLAAELVINHLTVKRAYEILEAENLIRTDRGRGTFVCERPAGRRLQSAARKDLERRLRDAAANAKLLGLNKTELVELLRKAWDKGGRR
jgi:GntR family transcriptional regulator